MSDNKDNNLKGGRPKRKMTPKEIKDHYFIKNGFSINSIMLKDENGNEYILNEGKVYKKELIEQFRLIE